MDNDIRKLDFSDSAIDNPLEDLRKEILNSQEDDLSVSHKDEKIKKLAKRSWEWVKNPLSKDCGNKYGNLIKMGSVVNALRLSNFRIPMPQGLSSDSIHEFWKSKNVQVLTYWKELNDLYIDHDSEHPFLEEPEVVAKLDRIQEVISQVFSYIGEVPLPDDWIQENQGHFIMVRSSGSEDSQQLANAGGNVSKSYVPANREAICNAVCEVIQSYFSKGSLQNRINAGMNPFEEEVKLGVVLQELIGEPVFGADNAEDIPVSFVLFSNEPLFVGGEPFRIMQIAATYGHGEAVVGSQGIGTDTALVLHSVLRPHELFVVYTNQEKTERLAPVQVNPTVLSKIENPEHLVYKPALSHEQVAQIYRDAILVEGIFDENATDIEGVMKNGVVHFVQARPVNRKPVLPTYLRSMAGAEESIQAEAIVSASSSVVKIQDRKDILFARTLEEAEEQLHMASPPKLVVVTDRPAATSHPVVNFRGLNIPCLYLPHLSALDAMCRKIDQERHLAVCMQTATIHLWNHAKADLQHEIVSGFAVHPASIAISLPTDGEWLAPPSASNSLEIKTLLNQRKWSEIEQKIVGLRGKIQEIQEKIGENPPAVIQKRLAILRELEKNLTRTLEETIAGFEMQGALRLRSLFYLKALETLLIGSQTPHRAIGQYNLLDADRIVKDIEGFLTYQQELAFAPRLMSLLPMGAFASQEWRSFLVRCEKETPSLQTVEKFHRLIETLHQTGALPIWFTFFQKNSSMTEIVEEFNEDMQSFIVSLLKEQKEIKKIDLHLDRFTDPKHFSAAAKELQSKVSLWQSREFLAQIQGSSRLGKIMAYQTLALAVDLLDRAVKEMKASQAFSVQEKTQLFADLLQSYFELMSAWVLLIPKDKAINLGGDWRGLSGYVKDIQVCMENRFKLLKTASLDALQAELLPSKEFSVSAAMLGSRAAFYRHQPQTLEDMLTLLHQNSLVALNVLGAEELTQKDLDESLLPSSFLAAMKVIEGPQFSRHTQRIGFQLNENEIVAMYNVPLQNHSGHLNLRYDPVTRQMNLHGQFLGEARERWEEISVIVQALHDAGLIVQAKPFHKTQQELSFDWIIPNPEHLKMALEEYDMMCDMTFRYGGKELERHIQQCIDRWSLRGEEDAIRRGFHKTVSSVKNLIIFSSIVMALGTAAFLAHNGLPTFREKMNSLDTSFARDLVVKWGRSFAQGVGAALGIVKT